MAADEWMITWLRHLHGTIGNLFHGWSSMPSHNVHDWRITISRHTVLQYRTTQDIFSGTGPASEPVSKTSAHSCRHEAVVAHAHAFSLLRAQFALKLLIGYAQAPILLRHVIHRLLKAINGELHLIDFKVLPLDRFKIFLNHFLVSFRLLSQPLIFIFRCRQFWLESTLLIPQVI